MVEDTYAVVSNLYTLSGEFCCFTVQDLNNAFFCKHLDSESQELFAFAYEVPETKTRSNIAGWSFLKTLKFLLKLLERSWLQTYKISNWKRGSYSSMLVTSRL